MSRKQPNPTPSFPKPSPPPAPPKADRRGSLALAAGSAPYIQYQLEGQRKQDPRRWDEIAPASEDEESVREEEAEYRDYMMREKTGWLDFRVVRVTTTREILPNTELTDGYRRTGLTNQPKSERR